VQEETWLPAGLTPVPESTLARDPPETDPRRSPVTTWAAWSAAVALIGGFVLATVAGLAVDLPAVLLGAKITGSNLSPGLAVADTFVQDIAFVLAAVFCAKLGGRVARSWQFGLRRPGDGWWWASRLIFALIVLFLLSSVLWSEVFNPEKEKLLQQLGSNESAALLVLSAALTCVVAPICEEFLFRAYVFTALRNWRGTFPAALITAVLFGGVHAGSAPVLDLVPLAALGFGLCLLYRFTGSLYPPIIAHSINNSIAFSSLEGWGWQLPVLMAAALLAIWGLALAFRRVGIIERSVRLARLGA
jgi:membrane protease YdiL (CAAX protease family)